MDVPRLYDLIERLGLLLRTEERAAGGRQGLRPAQVAALSYLARANRYSDTPNAVTEFLGLTKGTVSQTLAVLRRKGLLAARGDAGDGRKTRLTVTPRGARVLAACVPPPVVRAALDEETEDGARQLDIALTGLLRRLQVAHGARSFGVCATCRHFRTEGPSVFRCGLTEEPLSVRDATRLCREHAAASGAPA